MKTGRATPRAVQVSEFLSAAQASLGLQLVAGEAGLSNVIREAAINRPGLAMTGFFKYFANRRIQVMGLAEQTYLKALTEAQRDVRLREFFAKRIPCVIVSRSLPVPPVMRRYAEEFRVPLLRSKSVTMLLTNAATIAMENLMAPRVKVQGTMMEIMGIGVLIEGPPGIGKSDTALGLIKKGHALVSDDITALRLDSGGAVIATPVDITRYHMEIRGLGIIHVPSLFGVASVREEKKLDLVVTLVGPDHRENELRGGEDPRWRQFLGTRVPQIHIAVVPGRDLANIVEAAALNMKLKRLGHDAEKELDEKLVKLMTGSAVSSD